MAAPSEAVQESEQGIVESGIQDAISTISLKDVLSKKAEE